MSLLQGSLPHRRGQRTRWSLAATTLYVRLPATVVVDEGTARGSPRRGILSATRAIR
jgi:hypothetical protein